MNIQKTAKIAIILLIAVISFTKIAPLTSSQQFHSHSINQTDDKISTVLKLSGGAAATSAVITLLPGDLCTPISEQLAELSKYFLIILSALYLEKSLISVSGYITFSAFIPIACVVWCLSIAFSKKNLRSIAGKIALLGFIIFLIVPASVKLSDIIYVSQMEKIENTIEVYEDLDIEGETDEGFIEHLTTITTETIDKITAYVSSLLESLAVMIVTACVIPVLVFVILIWFVKTLFSTTTLTLDKNAIDAISNAVK